METGNSERLHAWVPFCRPSVKEDFPWDTSPEELDQEGGSQEEGVAALSCEAFLFGYKDASGQVTWPPRGLAGWTNKSLLTTQG